MPPRPATGTLSRVAAQWREAGRVESLGEVRGMIGYKLGYHEALTRRILARLRAEMAATLDG
jgi:hypothetical protein